MILKRFWPIIERGGITVAAFSKARTSEYNGVTMSTPEAASVSDICARVKHLGYTKSQRVRLYGEEFEVVSEPFPEADGVAVHVKSRKNPEVRVLRLPTTVLQSVKGRRPSRVA